MRCGKHQFRCFDNELDALRFAAKMKRSVRVKQVYFWEM